jgi:hypothetical protein
MKEINYKDMKFNPFNLIGGEWMLVTAGNEQKCNTMTASWGHLGCLWGHKWHQNYQKQYDRSIFK